MGDLSRQGKETELPGRILRICEKRGWSLHWTHRGAYLHLEASELIEAIRGKKGDPILEAADVLIVLMSITEANDIPWERVEQAAVEKCDWLESSSHYKHEEWSE